MQGTLSLLEGFSATSATAGSSFGGVMNLLPFVAILVIMYFLMIRPQQKKEKQRQEMVAALKRGDRVLTTGGLIGTIHKVAGEGELVVEISEGTRVRLLSGAVTQVLDKTAPAHVDDEASTKKVVASSEEQGSKGETVKKTAPKKVVRKPASPRKAPAARRKKTESEAEK